MDLLTAYVFFKSEHIFLQKYTLKDLQLDEIYRNLLVKKGLPRIDSEYYTFLPYNELREITIESEKYLTLGSPFRLDEIRNLIVLKLANQKIYFFSEEFQQIAYYPKLVNIVNNDLICFVYFNYAIARITNLVLKDAKHLKFSKVEKYLQLFLSDLKTCDEDAVISKNGDKLFWQSEIYRLFQDIEERYDRFLNIDLENYFNNR